MKKSLDFILGTRDATKGHWRFRDDLGDGSGNGNDLTVVGSLAFANGYTEQGITIISNDGTAGTGVKLSAASAADFDMGMDNFSIEVIFNPVVSTAGQLAGKADSGPDTGWKIVLTLQKIYVFLGDGTNEKTKSTNTPIPNGLQKWYYFVLTVDRDQGQARMYINGVEDANSPYDISVITGNISYAASDLEIAWELDGSIDEVCISKEVITPANVALRFAGKLNPLLEYNPQFLMNFLPVIQHNDDLEEFLLPFSSRYLDSRDLANQLNNLSLWNKCPQHYLNLFLSLFNFELIDKEFATDVERHLFLKWVSWMYQRKGTTLTPQKIIELLGFTYDWIEKNPDWVPFVINFHRLWSRDLVAATSFEDNFSQGNLVQWNSPLSLSSWWRVSSGKLRGTGDGTSSDLNGITFNNSITDYYMEGSFQIFGSLDFGARFGFFLKYVDSSNWLRLNIRHYTDRYYLYLEKKISGAFSDTELCEVTDTIDQGTGVHKLWVHANHETDKYTIGVNSEVLTYETYFPTLGVDSSQKGLYVNQNLMIEFDDILVQTIDERLAARLISEEFQYYSVWLRLTNSPPYAEYKRAYLEQVLYKYVPFYIRLGWPHSPEAPTSIAFATGTISLKTGFILSGNRAIGFGLGTGTITYILSGMTMTPEAAAMALGTQFAQMIETPPSSSIAFGTGGITFAIMLIRVLGGRTYPYEDSNGQGILYNDIPALIDDILKSGDGASSHHSSLGIGLAEANPVSVIRIYDSHSTHPNDLSDDPSFNTVRVMGSNTNEYNSWTLHETFINPPRTEQIITLQLDTPINKKYIKINTHIGESGIKCSEDEWFIITEITVE